MDQPISLLSKDMLGWAAAGLTLMTFVCRDMRRLRLLALAANAAFIAYGALVNVLPVVALHLALVPVNLWRLIQTLRPVTRWAGTVDRWRPLRTYAWTMRVQNTCVRPADAAFATAPALQTLGGDPHCQAPGSGIKQVPSALKATSSADPCRP